VSELIAACSWSSGKDSCLALHKAMQEGTQIKYLFNFISHEYGRVSFHGTKNELVKLQSECIGIPLMQRETTKDDYEEVFKKTLQELKKNGINYIVRGDIHLLELQDWVERVCGGEGINVISPIWEKPTEDLLQDFIKSGFKAVLTSIQASKLDPKWIGHTIDHEFIAYLKSMENVDLCGENGEYHTFVYDGPIFNRSIKILKTDKVLRSGYWFLDIQEYESQKKGDKR